MQNSVRLRDSGGFRRAGPLLSPAWIAENAAGLARGFGARHSAKGCDMPPLLLLQDITLTFGVAPLLSGAGLAVATGDRICLVGRNGSGKSTLLRIVAGLVQ